jgi:hypothetical protein
MGKESYFIIGFEKKASLVAKILSPVKHYKEVANSPVFKAKKVIGWGMLGTGGLAYGLHKLHKNEEAMAPAQAIYGGPYGR